MVLPLLLCFELLFCRCVPCLFVACPPRSNFKKKTWNLRVGHLSERVWTYPCLTRVWHKLLLKNRGSMLPRLLECWDRAYATSSLDLLDVAWGHVSLLHACALHALLIHALHCALLALATSPYTLHMFAQWYDALCHLSLLVATCFIWSEASKIFGTSRSQPIPCFVKYNCF